VAAVERQQPEPGLVPQVQRQALHSEPPPYPENQPEEAPQELQSHLDSNSASANRPEQELEQASNSCIRSG
jgi:hypothetical protein